MVWNFNYFISEFFIFMFKLLNERNIERVIVFEIY